MRNLPRRQAVDQAADDVEPRRDSRLVVVQWSEKRVRIPRVSGGLRGHDATSVVPSSRPAPGCPRPTPRPCTMIMVNRAADGSGRGQDRLAAVGIVQRGHWVRDARTTTFVVRCSAFVVLRSSFVVGRSSFRTTNQEPRTLNDERRTTNVERETVLAPASPARARRGSTVRASRPDRRYSRRRLRSRAPVNRPCAPFRTAG